MAFAVELYLDKPAEKEVLRLMDLLPEQGLNSAARKKPRIAMTLAKFGQIDEAKAEERLKKLVRQQKRVQAVFPSLGVLPPETLYLGPVLNEFLYGFHLEIHEALHYSKEGFEHYSFGKWLPHLTLAHYSDREDLLQAFAILGREFQTLTGEFDRVALVSLDPAFREVCSFKLRP